MIPDLGPHSAFIWTSYALTFGVLIALTAWLLADYRHQTSLLAELEARRKANSPKVDNPKANNPKANNP